MREEQAAIQGGILQRFESSKLRHTKSDCFFKWRIQLFGGAHHIHDHNLEADSIRIQGCLLIAR
jgi:hypothetical protein